MRAFLISRVKADIYRVEKLLIIIFTDLVISKNVKYIEGTSERFFV